MATRRLLRPALVGALVLAHLGVALLLSLRPAPTPRHEARLQLRVIPDERPPPSPPTSPPPSPEMSAVSKPTPAPRPAVTAPAIVLLPPPATEPAAEPPPAAPPAAPTSLAEAPASAPQPLLLHTEATRRAVREAARNPPLAVVAQAGLPQRETRDQRLARTIAEAGRGDCNKGQFLGGGMGLLSLPFWVAAEATGQCAK